MIASAAAPAAPSTSDGSPPRCLQIRALYLLMPTGLPTTQHQLIRAPLHHRLAHHPFMSPQVPRQAGWKLVYCGNQTSYALQVRPI